MKWDFPLQHQYTRVYKGGTHVREGFQGEVKVTLNRIGYHSCCPSSTAPQEAGKQPDMIKEINVKSRKSNFEMICVVFFFKSFGFLLLFFFFV